MDRKNPLNLWYAVIALFAILAIERWWSESQRVETIRYSQFAGRLAAHGVTVTGLARAGDGN